MQPLFWIETVIVVIFLLSGFASIGVLLYIGKRHIKEVDRVALGNEIQDDSFAYLMLRVPNYTLAFIWRYYARRSGLLEIHDRFDKKFKRPFMINLWLLIIGMSTFIILIIFQKYYFV